MESLKNIEQEFDMNVNKLDEVLLDTMKKTFGEWIDSVGSKQFKTDEDLFDVLYENDIHIKIDNAAYQKWTEYNNGDFNAEIVNEVLNYRNTFSNTDDIREIYLALLRTRHESEWADEILNNT